MYLAIAAIVLAVIAGVLGIWSEIKHRAAEFDGLQHKQRNDELRASISIIRENLASLGGTVARLKTACDSNCSELKEQEAIIREQNIQIEGLRGRINRDWQTLSNLGKSQTDDSLRLDEHDAKLKALADCGKKATAPARTAKKPCKRGGK